MNFAITALAAALCGILAGLGVGGGTLLVVVLTMLLNTRQRDAQALNLAFFLAAAPCALIGHYKNRLIEWKAAAFAVPAGVITAIIAASLAQDFDPGWLKKGFGVLLLLLGLKELFHKSKQEGSSEDLADSRAEQKNGGRG